MASLYLARLPKHVASAVSRQGLQIGARNAKPPMKLSFRVAGLGTGLLCVYSLLPAAYCDSFPSEGGQDYATFIGSSWKGGGGGGGGGGGDDPMEKLIEMAYGQVSNIGFGGLMGICSGVAFKRVGTAMATGIGMCFAGLQLLSYFGYIKIDFEKVKDDAKKISDLNKDGKLDSKDLIVGWNKVKDVLGTNLPGMGGFSAGFAMGLYL